MPSLKTRTLKGLFWSFADSFGVYFIKFGFSIAIARALSPEDYGILGMILIFIAIGQMLMQSGFSMAIIQKRDANDIDFSTAFWFNLFVALIIYIILYISADMIANFFNKPILVGVTRIASIGIVINSLGTIQNTILAKNLNFKRQAYINFIGATLSGTTGVILAYKGYNVWALVFQTLTGSLISTLGLWIMSNWRPMVAFSILSFKQLFNYGYKILLQGLSDVIFSKLYFPLIGKSFSAMQLGFYTNASRFYDIFITQTTIAYGRVAFSAFSQIQDEKERFNKNYIKSIEMISLTMFLITTVLIVTIRPFISIFLTEKWLPAVSYMVIFFLEGFFFPLYKLNQNVLCSIGRTGLSFKIDLLKKIMTFISIFIAFPFGIHALIYGQVISTFVAFLISTYVVLNLQNLQIFKNLTFYIPIILITFFCLLINNTLIDCNFESDLLLLIAKIIIIPLLYIPLVLLTSKPAREMLIIVKDFIKPKYLH